MCFSELFVIMPLMPEALVCVRPGMRGEASVATHMHMGPEPGGVKCVVMSLLWEAALSLRKRRSPPQTCTDSLSCHSVCTHTHTHTHRKTRALFPPLCVMFPHNKGSPRCHFYYLPVINTFFSFWHLLFTLSKCVISDNFVFIIIIYKCKNG